MTNDVMANDRIQNKRRRPSSDAAQKDEFVIAKQHSENGVYKQSKATALLF
ncbi:MAG: hypothetical protein VXW49_13120 [Pseudomonadota bacterium]|nr:hypothetical protein [Pseudomonadota bacterium]